MSRLCTNCGGELREDAKFCSNCGMMVEPVAAPVAPQPEQPAYTAPEAPVQSQTPAYTAPEKVGYSAPQQPQPQAPTYAMPDRPAASGPVIGQPIPPKPYAPAEQPQQPRQYAPNGQQPPYYAPNSVPSQGQYGGPGYGVAPVYGTAGYGAPPQPQPKKKGKTGLIIGIIAGALVLIVGIVILLTSGVLGSVGGGGSSSPEDVINTYSDTITKMIDGNAKMEDLLKTVYEWNYLKPEKKSDFEEEMKEASDDFESGIALVKAFYDEMTYTCRVTDTETMSKSEMQEFLDDNGISENCTTDKITEMCNCTVVTTVTYGDEKSESETEMVCIKADGKWYLSFSALDM